MISDVIKSNDLHKIDPVFGQLSFDDHEQIVFLQRQRYRIKSNNWNT